MLEIKHKTTGEVLHRLDSDTLARADLSGVHLRGADLRHTLLFNTNLADADLTDADLTGARMPYVNLSGTILHRAKLIHTEITEAQGTGVILTEARLSGTAIFATDLHGANMVGAKCDMGSFHYVGLEDANLCSTDWHTANLSNCRLIGARMTGALLKGAHLTGVNLADTNLTDSHLVDAELNHSNLTGANLLGTLLVGTTFNNAILNQTNLAEAVLGATAFVNCRDLHHALGLTTMTHNGPSLLDTETLRACVQHLPKPFLLGAGLSQSEIEAFRALYSKPPLRNSCFLIYSQADGAFVERLRADLLDNNINCWQYGSPSASALPRERSREQQFIRSASIEQWRLSGLVPFSNPSLAEAIQSARQVFLVCSRAALTQNNIWRMLKTAIETKKDMLRCVLLDDFLSSAELQQLAREKLATDRRHKDLLTPLLTCPRIDFRNWHVDAAYRLAFTELLQPLKNLPV